MDIYSYFYYFNENLLFASFCCISFSLKSNHHIQRSLSPWKERVLFLPSTLALFPTVANIQTSADSVLSKHDIRNHMRHSVESREARGECRWPTLLQRGILSQHPELEHLLWGLTDLGSLTPELLRFKMSFVAMHLCNSLRVLANSLSAVLKQPLSPLQKW